MTIAVRRKNRNVGKGSVYLCIPRPVEVGEESTIVVDRLLLADPRGKISEEKLLKFAEEQVEPMFWEWMRKKEKSDD